MIAQAPIDDRDKNLFNRHPKRQFRIRPADEIGIKRLATCGVQFGRGGVNHLITELFSAAAGIELVHVPYKGAGPAMIALLSREVDMTVASPVAIMPQVRSGQVRAIAVSGALRSPALPEVPTISESGLPGFDSTAWYCMMAPAGTPRAIIDKVRAALVQALRTPAVTDRLNGEGAAPEPSTPEELAKLIRDDLQRWARAVRISGAKLD